LVVLIGVFASSCRSYIYFSSHILTTDFSKSRTESSESPDLQHLMSHLHRRKLESLVYHLWKR